MEKWEKVLNEFLKEYVDDDSILGAILGGSYATGNYTENSDIDISIITTNDNYKKRGNVIIDDIMIEYFINPISELKKYMEDDYNNRHRLSTSNLIGNGKIIFSRGNIMEDLQKEALSYYDKEFPTPDETKVKCQKYACWDAYDELKDKVKNNESYNLNYFVLLQNLIDCYYYSNNVASVPISKLEQILRNKEYARKYNLKNEPSEEFKRLVLECIDTISIDKINELYKFVIKDWNITDFVLENNK